MERQKVSEQNSEHEYFVFGNEAPREDPFMKSSLFIFILFASTVQAQTWNHLLDSVRPSTHSQGACPSCVISPNGGGNVAVNPISSADLCTSPASTICAQFQNSTVDAVQAGLRHEVADTADGDAFDHQFQIVTQTFNSLPRTASATQIHTLYVALLNEEKKQMSLIAALENKILTKFNKTPGDLAVFFEQIRTSLINHVNASPEFDRHASAQLITPTRDDVIRKLKSVKLETAQSIANDPDPTDEAGLATAIMKRNSYYTICGPDGLQVNAFYDSSSNSLKICPGFLMENLNDSNGRIEPLAMVLGHELGHSIDAEAHMPIQNDATLIRRFPHAKVDRSSHACYRNFLGCVDQKYITPNVEHFGTLTSAVEQLKNRGVPGLKAELTRLQNEANPDMDQIARVKSSLVTGQSRLNQYTSQRDTYIASHQNPNQVIVLQDKEMTADYNSVFALNDQLKSVPQDDRAAIASQAYRLFCGTPAGDRVHSILWGTQNDALHPPNQFRMEMTFRNPETRRLLGCNPISTPRPWCDINTPSSAH
jgi:hypothetical protein